MSERVILAYSGGLDTSVAISWIGKETGREVVAVAIDLGQGGEDMEVVRQRALDCGAVEAVVVDARDEFADDYCLPTILSNALYMDRYPLVSAISRPARTADRAIGIDRSRSMTPFCSSWASEMAVPKQAKAAVWAMIPGIRKST